MQYVRRILQYLSRNLLRIYRNEELIFFMNNWILSEWRETNKINAK